MKNSIEESATNADAERRNHLESISRFALSAGREMDFFLLKNKLKNQRI